MNSLIPQRQLDILKDMIRATPTNGIMVEVGVYKGGSAAQFAVIARERGQELWLFDTFSGMPEASDCDHHQVGEFADCSVDSVRGLIPDAKIFQGFFPATWRPEPDTKIAFAHIDCDQYASIRECILAFQPLMLDGGLMWFDDYGHAHLPSAKAAVDEFLPERTIHNCGRAYYVF